MKATFIDFEDSFSYNIIQELELVGFKVEVINWKNYDHNPDSGLLVLGPGPGHPDDYQRIYSLLQNWLKHKRPLFGVCLGHQIYWRLMNVEVVRSKLPLHGQKMALELSKVWRQWLKIDHEVFVQRYNSLAVFENSLLDHKDQQNFCQNGEVLITRSSNVITYQFHPESIGTTFRKEFMQVIWSIV
jgi:anthranilate/para-aminobenzoate synthase component II